MRTSRLLARIEALEALLKPKGRLFVFADFDGDPATYEERLAAFSVEHGVGPNDKLLEVRTTFHGPSDPEAP
jgi:hypothetical protein